MSEIEDIGGDEPLDAPVEAPAERVVPPETVALAERYGWKPKDASTLPDGSWMDAEQFVKATKTQVRILRDDVAAKDKRIEAAEAMARTAADTVRRQERAAYEQRLADIREAKAEAVSTADVDRYKELEQREQKLTAPEREVDPTLDAYAKSDAGAWTKDPILFEFAVNAINKDAEAMKKSPIDQAKWAADKLKEYFPHKFPTPPEPPRDEAGRFSRVDAGGLAPRSGPNYNLSSEETAEVQHLIKRGVFKTVAEYVDYSKKLGVRE
jgi:hypothetical protein